MCATSPYLPVGPDGPPAVAEQLRHVVEAGELPQARLQVQVPVEAQGVGGAHGAAVLVGRRLADDLGVLGGVRDEAVARLDLVEVQQVGAAVVAHARAVRAQGQLEVLESSGRDDGQHAWRNRGRAR